MLIFAIHKNVALWYFRALDQLLKKLYFCDILEGVLRTPSLSPSPIWIRTWRGCRARLDIILFEKNHFGKILPGHIINGSTTDLTLFRCRSSPTFLCRAWSRSKLFAKVIINFFEREALYKIVRYKIYKIQLIRLKIRIRISTSESRSGLINSVAGG